MAKVILSEKEYRELKEDSKQLHKGAKIFWFDGIYFYSVDAGSNDPKIIKILEDLKESNTKCSECEDKIDVLNEEVYTSNIKTHHWRTYFWLMAFIATVTTILLFLK